MRFSSTNVSAPLLAVMLRESPDLQIELGGRSRMPSEALCQKNQDKLNEQQC